MISPRASRVRKDGLQNNNYSGTGPIYLGAEKLEKANQYLSDSGIQKWGPGSTGPIYLGAEKLEK
jgi:hypothetical protein